jgi:hypothetical protein
VRGDIVDVQVFSLLFRVVLVTGLGQCACYVTFHALMWNSTDFLGTGLGVYGNSMIS